MAPLVRSASEPTRPNNDHIPNNAFVVGSPIPLAEAGSRYPALASPGSRGIEACNGTSAPWPHCLDIRSPDSVASPSAASPPWLSPVSGWRQAITPDPLEDAVAAFVTALCTWCRDEREKIVWSVAPVPWVDSNYPNFALCYQDGPILEHAAKHAMAQERDGECLGRGCVHNEVHFISRDKVANEVVAATLPRYQAEAYVRNRNMKQLPRTSTHDQLVVFLDSYGQAPAYAVFHITPAAHDGCPRVHGLADRLQLLHEQDMQDGNATALARGLDPVACAERALRVNERETPEACIQRWHELKALWSACVVDHGEMQTRAWLQDTLMTLDVRTLPLVLAAAMDADGVPLPRERLYLRALIENRPDFESFFARAGLQHHRLDGVNETFVSLLPHSRRAADRLLQRASEHVTASGWLAAHALAQQSAHADLSAWLEERKPLSAVLPPVGKPSADTSAARLRHFHQRVLATHNPYLAVCVISETLRQQGNVEELTAWRRLCHAQGIEYLVRPGTYEVPSESIGIDAIVGSSGLRGRSRIGMGAGATNPAAGTDGT